MTLICVNKPIIIDSDNGLSPGRRRAIIWTNDRILLIFTIRDKLEWTINRNSYIFLKKWRPFCLCLNELNVHMTLGHFDMDQDRPLGQNRDATCSPQISTRFRRFVLSWLSYISLGWYGISVNLDNFTGLWTIVQQVYLGSYRRWDQGSTSLALYERNPAVPSQRTRGPSHYTYDVTSQIYRKSHTKYKVSKIIFCDAWVQNFVWNFKGALWNFTQKFEPIHRKIYILRAVKKLTT